MDDGVWLGLGRKKWAAEGELGVFECFGAEEGGIELRGRKFDGLRLGSSVAVFFSEHKVRYTYGVKAGTLPYISLIVTLKYITLTKLPFRIYFEPVWGG